MKRLLDVYLVADRNLRKSLRTPQFIVVEILVQPVIFVLLFAYVFGGAIHIPGVSYIDFLLPGILVQTATFAGMNTGLALAEDLRNGLMDRLWSLPMSRFAVITGRIAADTLLSAVAVLVMIGVGSLIGFRFHGAPLEAFAAIGIAVLAGTAFGWVGAVLAVVFRSPEGVQSVGFSVIFPVVFASSVFVPVSTLPWWLQPISQHTPITATVNAVRALTLGQPLQSMPVIAVGSLLAVTLVAATVASVFYRRMGR